MPKVKKIQKRLSVAELRIKPLSDLVRLRDEIGAQMVGVKMEIGLGTEKNVRTYKNLRREYAVVCTLIREKGWEEVEQVDKVEQVVTSRTLRQSSGQAGKKGREVKNNHESI